jgi:hypothetical protein
MHIVFIILWVTYRKGLDDASGGNGALDQVAMKASYTSIACGALSKQHNVVTLLKALAIRVYASLAADLPPRGMYKVPAREASHPTTGVSLTSILERKRTGKMPPIALMSNQEIWLATNSVALSEGVPKT